MAVSPNKPKRGSSLYSSRGFRGEPEARDPSVPDALGKEGTALTLERGSVRTEARAPLICLSTAECFENVRFNFTYAATPPPHRATPVENGTREGSRVRTRHENVHRAKVPDDLNKSVWKKIPINPTWIYRHVKVKCGDGVKFCKKKVATKKEKQKRHWERNIGRNVTKLYLCPIYCFNKTHWSHYCYIVVLYNVITKSCSTFVLSFLNFSIYVYSVRVPLCSCNKNLPRRSPELTAVDVC